MIGKVIFLRLNFSNRISCEYNVDERLTPSVTWLYNDQLIERFKDQLF